MKLRQPFSPAAFLWLVCVSVILFAMTVLLTDTGPDQTAFRNRFGPGAFSASAVGCAGLYETMRRLDWPVRRGARSARAAAAGGILVVAEPEPEHSRSEGTPNFSRAGSLLLVLPKWRGVRHPGRPEWITDAEPASEGDIRHALSLVPLTGTAVRVPWPEHWESSLSGAPPAGDGEVQLLQSRQLEPVVGTADGMLVGEFVRDGQRVWVLSDPDVMANHGIARDGNLRFMLSLFTALGGTEKPLVVFDEEVHGYREYLGSPARLLWSFPGFVITILALSAAVFFLLAGVRRFGPARPAPAALQFGKAQLLSSTARLLEMSGHSQEVLWRYLDMCLRQTAAGLHAPAGLDREALTAWLDNAGGGMQGESSCEAILRTAGEIDPHGRGGMTEIIQCARAMHAWKREMLDGTGTDR